MGAGIEAGASASAACGSGTNSTATQPAAPKLSPVKVARDQVTNMVLNTGDLPGFTLQSDGPETLKDQLPPKGMPHFAATTGTVRANWLASEHSIVISADGRVPLISDANLFKSVPAAMRIWQLEQLPPHETLAKQRMAGGVGPMRLENVLREVQPNRSDLLHGRLLR